MKRLVLVLGILATIASLFLFKNDAHGSDVTIMSGGVLVGGSARMRQIFDQISKEDFADGKIVVESYLRVEQKIVNGKDQYTLNFTQDTKASLLTEKKLDRNDYFVITQLGYFLSKKDDTKKNIEVLQTYPNKIIFADGTNFKGENLGVMYNGSMALKINSKEWFPSIPLDRFYNVGSMTKSSATTESNRTSWDGFIDIEPRIILLGGDPHSLTINVPVEDGLIVQNDVSGMHNYIVVQLRGFLVKK